MKAKMRIKSLDSNLIVLKDRLVDQDTEFYNGPSEKHKGPISMEITLRDQTDINSFKSYLDKFLGDLPIPEKIKKSKTPEVDIEPIVQVIKEVKEFKIQDEVIKYLRERGFKFVTAQFILDREIGTEIPCAKGTEQSAHEDKFQYMIRLLKEGKDPKADKYDPQLVIALDFIGKPGVFKIYTYGKFSEKITLPWAKKSSINFKKIAHLRFPHFMVQDERDRYSLEIRKMKLNPELKPTKFFERWKPAVDKENKVTST
jgi:hypothetical protein